MANIASAKKRARQSEKLRLHNASHRSMLRTQIKRVVIAIESKNKEAAQTAYQTAVPVIKAARHKSRLNSHLRAL